MKVRESGMPPIEMWHTFFDPDRILAAMEVTSAVHDAVDFGCGYGTFAIPAAKGIEFGSGFAGSAWRGSRNNDALAMEGGRVLSRTNNAGGILGGLSTGMPVVFRVAFKPASSIAKAQKTLNVRTGLQQELNVGGRHDACVAIRAVPVVECVAAIVAADILREGDENENRQWIGKK